MGNEHILQLFKRTQLQYEIYYHFSCHDLSSWEVYDSLFQVVKSANEKMALPDEVR